MSLMSYLTQGADERREVVVTGEDGEAETYYAAPLTVRDLKTINRLHKNFLQEMQVEGMVDLLIMKLENHDGTKVLSKEDKPALMRKGRLERVAHIFGEVFGSMTEDVEKN